MPTLRDFDELVAEKIQSMKASDVETVESGIEFAFMLAALNSSIQESLKKALFHPLMVETAIGCMSAFLKCAHEDMRGWGVPEFGEGIPDTGTSGEKPIAEGGRES